MLAVPGSPTSVGSMVRRGRSDIPIDRPPVADGSQLRWDLAISGALGCVAAVVAHVFIRDYGRAFFYQSFMPSIVMYACGHGFVEPVVRPAELALFLAGSAPAFDCNVLAETRQTQAPVPFTYSHLYLAIAVGQTWRWLGVSYQKLWPLLALLHAAYVVGAFALARLFLPRNVSIVVASFIAVSPIAVSMMSALRDYAKAPFALWALVFLLLSIRARSLNSLLAFAALAGATVGVGRGFRSELAMFIPIGAVALAIGLDRRFRIGARIGAPVAFLAIAFVALLPTQSPHRGQQGLLIMEGSVEPFQRHLGVGPALYDLGSQYADELVLASIASDLRRLNPLRYDAREERHDRSPPQAFTRSNAYVLGWFPLFSADFATRALKSGVLLLGFPAMFSPPRSTGDPIPPAVTYVRGGVVSEASVRWLNYLGVSWLPALGGAALFSLLFQVYARAPREAAALGFLLAFLLTYPSLQFSGRHFFHVEVLFWTMVGSLPLLWFRARELRPHLGGFVRIVAALSVAGSALYLGLRLAQDRMLKTEVARLLGGSRVPVAVVEVPGDGARTLFSVPIPPDHQATVTRLPDGLTKSKVSTSIYSAVWAESDRLLITVGGERCGSEPLTVELIYEKTPDAWQPLDRRFDVPVEKHHQTLVVTSAFYRPTQHFRGISIERGRAECVMGLSRLTGPSRLPSIFSVILPSDWAERDFFVKLW
jgi:hypothetical protein